MRLLAYSLSIILSFFLFLSCGTDDNVIEFDLHPNGITIQCASYNVGDIGVVNGVEYEVVSNDLLRQRRDEGSDLTKVCVSLVTTMTGLLRGRDLNFNQPIGNWDVSNVESMVQMFAYSQFNQSIENWDVSNVERMDDMFANSQFNQSIEDWDVSNVEQMPFMFSQSPFNQPLEEWDVSSVTNMVGMFLETPFNQSIENWDVSLVNNMDGMFFQSPFNHNISKWCVQKIGGRPTDFSSNLSAENHPVWGTCPD